MVKLFCTPCNILEHFGTILLGKEWLWGDQCNPLLDTLWYRYGL